MLSQGFSPGAGGSFYSPGWPFEQQDGCSQGLRSPAFLATPPYPCPNTTKERSSAPTEPPQVFFANSPNHPLSHPCRRAQSCSNPPFPRGSECCPWEADGSGGAVLQPQFPGWRDRNRGVIQTPLNFRARSGAGFADAGGRRWI